MYFFFFLPQRKHEEKKSNWTRKCHKPDLCTTAICYSSTCRLTFIVTLNESYTSTNSNHSGVALILSTVHTHAHTHTHTHTVLPEGDCEEDAVRVKWSSEAARQKNEWSDWHRSSRQGLPGLFLKCWCLELRHTLCSSSGVSVGKHSGVWSSLSDNWKNTEMLQNKHSLLLHWTCVARTYPSLSLLSLSLWRVGKKRCRHLKSFW